MRRGAASRVRVTFGVLNAFVALILVVAELAYVRPHCWPLDASAALVSSVELVSAVALLADLSWALRALRTAAWVSLVVGLVVVALVGLTMAFLAGVHGDTGYAGALVSGLVIALLVPYTIVLPALQLLWLGRQVRELQR